MKREEFEHVIRAAAAIVLAKLAAGRPHDFEFVEEAIRSRLVDRDQLLLGLDLMPESHRARTRERLVGLLARIDS